MVRHGRGSRSERPVSARAASYAERRARADARRAERGEIEDPAVVLEAAAAFLAVRPRSVDETRRRLRHLGYPDGLGRRRHRPVACVRLPRRRRVRACLGREPGPGTPAGRVGAPPRADAQGHRPRGHRRGPGGTGRGEPTRERPLAMDRRRCRADPTTADEVAARRLLERRAAHCGASPTPASGARRPTPSWRATASIRVSAHEPRRHASPRSSRTRLATRATATSFDAPLTRA